jgi:hypothetical protein
MGEDWKIKEGRSDERPHELLSTFNKRTLCALEKSRKNKWHIWKFEDLSTVLEINSNQVDLIYGSSIEIEKIFGRFPKVKITAD